MHDNVPETLKPVPAMSPSTPHASAPHASPPPAPASILPTPKRFPTPSLILMSVLSCFLATAAVSSAVFSFKAPVIVPTAISFCLTVPYHVYLYLDAQKHRRSSTHSDPVFISTNCIIYGFLLVPLWVAVFVMNIVDHRIHGRRRVPIIVATIWSGLEWMILLFIALKSAREVWRVESHPSSIIEEQSNLQHRADGPNPAIAPAPKPRHLFLISFILCTLTLAVSINFISLAALANLIVFLITAPYHISLYVASLRPRSPTPLFARRYNVPCAFLLAALWCWLFVIKILVAHSLWRRIVSGIFSGLEGIIVIGLTAWAVLDSFADGNIKL